MFLALLVSVFLPVAVFAGGRPSDTTKDFFFHLNTGWVEPDSSTVEGDLTFGAGLMYWPEKWHVGTVLDLSYTRFDVSNSALDRINDSIASDPNNSGTVDGGNIRNWKVALNLVWGPGSSSNGLYVTGGVSANFLEGRLTHTGLVYYPPYCDPWIWWWCAPGGIGTGDIIRAKESTTRMGYNVGLGWNFDFDVSSVFIEIKYEAIDTGGDTADFVPLTIGIRY